MTELSLRMARHHFERVEVYTDSHGAKQIEELGVDVNIKCTHDRFMYNVANPTQCWAFAKLYTYALQTEPYAHLDNDVLICSGIRPWARHADCVVQHFETHDYVMQGLESVMKDCKCPGWFRELLPSDWFGSNAGIIGFNDIEASHFYAIEALKFVEQNFEWATTGRNFMWVEQVPVGAAAVYKDIEIRPLLMGFHHMPYLAASGYRHVWGTLKHKPEVMAGIRKELEDYKNGKHFPLQSTVSPNGAQAGSGGRVPFDPGSNPAGGSTDFSVPVGRPVGGGPREPSRERVPTGPRLESRPDPWARTEPSVERPRPNLNQPEPGGDAFRFASKFIESSDV